MPFATRLYSGQTVSKTPNMNLSPYTLNISSSNQGLHILDPETATEKSYVPSQDRRLRETQDIASPRLPPFSGPNRIPQVNPLMVILSGEIKFRRFIRDLPQSPFPQSLPADVMDLIHKTINLVDLIYWKPEPREGTQGHKIYMQRFDSARRNDTRKAQSSKRGEDKGASDNAMNSSGSNSGTEYAHNRSQGSRRREFSFPEGASLERRRKIASLLMSGHGRLSSTVLRLY